MDYCVSDPVDNQSQKHLVVSSKNMIDQTSSALLQEVILDISYI